MPDPSNPTNPQDSKQKSVKIHPNAYESFRQGKEPSWVHSYPSTDGLEQLAPELISKSAPAPSQPISQQPVLSQAPVSSLTWNHVPFRDEKTALTLQPCFFNEPRPEMIDPEIFQEPQTLALISNSFSQLAYENTTVKGQALPINQFTFYGVLKPKLAAIEPRIFPEPHPTVFPVKIP